MNEAAAQQLRIIFMGTPEFAVASLDALCRAGMQVVAVVTAPDKPAGRGMQLQQSAVKQYAVEKNILVLQPEKLKAPEFVAQLAALKADIQVVVAFRMLPELVWNMPPLGTLNVHGSLLPKYRGAAPINWAIINGEKETGVTTFKLQHAIDTGNILQQASMPILPEDNMGTVHDKMKILGAQTLVSTLTALANHEVEEHPQDNEAAVAFHAPKIFTETCVINFSKTVAAVNNLIRGLSPFPTAFTQFDGKKLKIFSATPIETNTTDAAYVTDGKTYLHFKCANGYIAVNELQMEGKKRMLIADFLRGYRFA